MRRARCRIEHHSALESLDLARFVAAELQGLEGGGSLRDDRGSSSFGEIIQSASALPELPMPHVMACFDVSFHGERRQGDMMSLAGTKDKMFDEMMADMDFRKHELRAQQQRTEGAK